MPAAHLYGCRKSPACFCQPTLLGALSTLTTWEVHKRLNYEWRCREAEGNAVIIA